MTKAEEHSGDFPKRTFTAILMASDFTQGALYAATTIPNLTLYRFRLSKLDFSEVFWG
jgi:hypothetical protein